jgi:hypothetical protein
MLGRNREVMDRLLALIHPLTCFNPEILVDCSRVVSIMARFAAKNDLINAL